MLFHTMAKSSNQVQLTQSSAVNGYTLIEVLIAVLIMSIGLLGMAGIQVKGMRGTQNTFLKSTATNLAQSMAERMHANVKGAETVEDDVTHKKFYLIDDTTTETCGTEHSCIGAGANCTSAEMAEADMFEWICGIKQDDGFYSGGISNPITGARNALPHAKASITCIDKDNTDGVDNPCSPGSTRVISITYDETNLAREGGTETTTADYTTRTITLNTVP